MLAVLVNTIAVIVGSLIGLLFKKSIPKKISDAIMIGIALCTVYIGISGALKGENTIVLIISIVLGAITGTLLDIDGFVDGIGNKLQNRFGGNKISEGFMTASLLFCIGAMTIVGSLNAGLGDYEMIFTKSVLDFISAIMLSVSLGIGVLFSAAFVLVFQGLLTLLSSVIAPVLSTEAINEMICAGSILIIGMGLNMLGATKIKVANYLPAIFFAPLIYYLVNIF